jgi:hypothetical protein
MDSFFEQCVEGLDIPKNWESTAWGNNDCMSYEVCGLAIWVDHPDPKMREHEERCRFAVTTEDSDIILESESFDDLLGFVNRYARKKPVPFEHDGNLVTNPFLSECGRFDVNPKDYYGVDVCAMKLEQMAEELNLWLDQNNLPHQCAQELLTCHDDLTDGQKEWLSNFVSDWERIQDGGEDALKTVGNF